MQLKIEGLGSDRRNMIVNAALKEFASKGYDEASTNIIAKEAGISKSLLFHYVNNKKDFFLFLYDYCAETMNREYLELMNFSEKDIFERLRQSYLLQIELVQKHPWIFDFNKITVPEKSEEINKELKKRIENKQALCFESTFEIKDTSKFKTDLNLDQCKQLIFWMNIGFSNELLDHIRKTEISAIDYDEIVVKLDLFFAELRKLFYKKAFS